jgi:hypothetical protein
MLVAIFTHAIEVAKKIKGPDFIGRGCAEDAAPDPRCFGASDRLAILVSLGEFQSNGANIGT